MPPLPEVKQDDDLSGQAVRSSPAVQAADDRATAESFRARGEHRAMLPSADFAAQYGLLARYNNYDEFFKTFQRQQCHHRRGAALSIFQSIAARPRRGSGRHCTEGKERRGSGEEPGLRRNLTIATLGRTNGRRTGGCGSRIPRWGCLTSNRCKSALTPGAQTGTTFKTRESNKANVTILYRTRTSNWSEPESRCCGLRVNWKAGLGLANRHRNGVDPGPLRCRTQKGHFRPRNVEPSTSSS